MASLWDKSVGHIAIKLGKSPYMVRKYARKKLFGQAARRIGGTWCFNEEALDLFLAGEKVEMRRGRPSHPSSPAFPMFHSRLP